MKISIKRPESKRVCYIFVGAAAVFLLAAFHVHHLLTFNTTTVNVYSSNKAKSKHMYPLNSVQPRIFTATQNLSALCIPFTHLMGHDRNSPSEDGLLLVRIPKTGSSTVGGVAARIAYKMAYKYYRNDSIVCKSRLTHAWSAHSLKRNKSFANRNRNSSFLWTLLRNPSDRAQSGYYFFHATQQHDSAISTIQKHPNHLLKWTSSNYRHYTPAAIHETIKQFNFMGLLERLDESLVILQLLLGLQPQDVLYLTGAKKSASFDISNQCRQLPENIKTPTLQEYFNSEQWFQDNHGDYMLYNAVNRSLDLTIERYIGRSEFDAALKEFQRAQRLANKHCEYKSPCIANGVYRPKNETGAKCYAEDWGCGYECLDALFPA